MTLTLRSYVANKTPVKQINVFSQNNVHNHTDNGIHGQTGTNKVWNSKLNKPNMKSNPITAHLQNTQTKGHSFMAQPRHGHTTGPDPPNSGANKPKLRDPVSLQPRSISFRYWASVCNWFVSLLSFESAFCRSLWSSSTVTLPGVLYNAKCRLICSGTNWPYHRIIIHLNSSRRPAGEHHVSSC